MDATQARIAGHQTELEQLHNVLRTRCVSLAGELSVARQTIAQAEKTIDDLKAEIEALKKQRQQPQEQAHATRAARPPKR